MGGKLRQPKIEGGAKLKAPTVQTELPPQQRKPKFSLEYLQKDYCLSKCETGEKAAFADKMLTLTSLTWVQISSAPRHGLGFEKIARTSISSGIPSVITEDVNIIAFRFNGKAPVVGFRREDTFYAVWFDRAFSLYDHGS